MAQKNLNIMSEIRFTLKEPKGVKETLIYLIYNFNYNRLKYSTGEFINPINWDSSNQRAKLEKKLNKPLKENLKSVNLQLNRYEESIGSILTDFKKQNQQPTIDTIRMELDKEFKNIITHRNAPDLLSFIETYNKEVKIVMKNKKPVTINERTKKKYKTTLKVLREFAESRGMKKIKFETIDKKFYYDFIYFMQNTKNYKENTKGKYIANLKAFLNVAEENGNIITYNYNKYFTKPSEEVEKIYLTETELMKLYELDLQKNSKLDKVRDLFLIGCYTALRYSDYTNIKPENIYTNDTGIFIKLKTFKTDTTVIIPLHWMVKEILNKYDNKLPSAISNQKMNDYLKDIGEMAKINSLVTTYKMEEGLKTTEIKKKHKLISTHTARRTGATNMYINKIPVHSIMKLTGHKTEKAFLTYLRFNDEDNANILADSPFFKQTRLKIAN